MIRESLEQIRDAILLANTYFTKGFADVSMDEATGIVHNNIPVFPADTFGDYFYLRLPDTFTGIAGDSVKIQDCTAAIGLLVNPFLIAVVKGADSLKLIDNLIYTIKAFGDDVRVQNVIVNADAVINQELAKMKKENRLKALQNFDSNTTAAISIRFSYTLFYPDKSGLCIENPCKEC